MTPDDFVRKWRNVALTERAAAQSHFIDLCRMLDEPAPTDADPAGEWYAFERGASKTGGGEGWADVWKRGHFGWEYKGRRKDLKAALIQLQQYALALENPPLLVVCDMDRFEIHTNWTNSVSVVHAFSLDDLRDAEVRRRLKSVFSDPEQLRPGKTRQKLTEEAATEFARLAQRLRDRGHGADVVAHFINRLVFCMFAEDVGLLPGKLLRKVLEVTSAEPHLSQVVASSLFKAMQSGGVFGADRVEWFNGGLFDDDHALPLDRDDIRIALAVARLDWAEIDPSILGTLFERGLDPAKRSQLGAHYTDRDRIMMIVDAVVVGPWLAQWGTEKAGIAEAMEKSRSAKSPRARRSARDQAEAQYRSFLEKLRSFRVLDPACGSGNFLYLALLSLKDIEHRVSLEAEALGLQREFPQIGPAAVLGIEINAFAAELARVSVWIGEIQWMLRNGFGVSERPILKQVNNIECRDAILRADGSAAVWPRADVVIGNPPFLGGKLLRSLLGDGYVDRLFAAYRDCVPPEADLVTYWVAKAWTLVATGQVARSGLVATNSIRGGANRRVIAPIIADGVIFAAWDDEPWVIDGAAVRVSIICFQRDKVTTCRLNGRPVPQINADLTGTELDLTRVAVLTENAAVAFMGDTKGGAFDVPGELARKWLLLPRNPNGKANSAVLRPWVNGMDLSRRGADKWIIDFGWEMSEEQAALFEAPFVHVHENVKPVREHNNRDLYRRNWWRHVEPRPGMWARVSKLRRYIATPRVARHRVFVWLNSEVCPDSATIAIARDDDVTFGILHSRFHEQWSLQLGTSLEDRPRYTPSTTFETSPFPDRLTPELPADDVAVDPRGQAIADAARRLNALRDQWLNPADLVIRKPEVVAGYPDRVLPKDETAAKELKGRTLTSLYNARPQWLANAYAELDAAVAAAYGWPAEISKEDALARLYALNQDRTVTR